MWCYLAGGVVSGLFLIFSLSVWLKYRAIYAATHLREFAEGMARIKDEALASIGRSRNLRTLQPGQLPPGTLKTSAGIWVDYSIEHEDGKYIHQLLLSHKGDWFSLGAARLLVAYVHHLLGLETTPLSLGVSSWGRYYVGFELDEDAQDVFAHRRVPVPELERISEVSESCWQLGQNLHFEPFEVKSPASRSSSID